MMKFIIMLFTFLLTSCDDEPNSQQNASNIPVDCVNEVVIHNIKGTSLTGLIANGSKVKVLHGFYNCHSVERGDLVVFSNPAILGGANIIKIAVGVAGDRVDMIREDGRTYLYINNDYAFNPVGKKYMLGATGESYIGLALGGKSFGTIPRGHYLVLGTATIDGKSTTTSGTLDSRRFGFVAHRDLVGKAERFK